MDEPEPHTLERWAWDFVRSTSLELAPAITTSYPDFIVAATRHGAGIAFQTPVGIERELREEARFRPSPGEAVPGHQTANLLVPATVRNHQPLIPAPGSRLDHERRVHDDDSGAVPRLESGGVGVEDGENPGVEDLLEFLALCGVGEHDFPQIRAADPPIVGPDPRSERLRDRLHCGASPGEK